MFEKIDVFNEVAEELESMGYEAEAHEDYSGRGMFGDKVEAISGDFPGAILGYMIAQVCRRNDIVEHTARDMVPMRTDSLGLYVIYY